ncbi:lysophospholipid acyltransferase family protein [Alkalilacustris brevis]|uniref:lysophospholipid acyltransferase family protein n=1 Tax=Alkalilacustris brevis TaxID=2026338 RepID=UPI000E0D22B1|nr:1-acyl-sn-glycerol-3-phosphate acyltransferase [Alkalilacustris brevis]
MAHALQWTRSLVFIGQMYLMMALIALFFTPWAIASQRGALAGIRCWCRWVRWSARWMVGLRSEVRGEVPGGAVLVAAKHQSFFDIIILFSELPRPRFVMKKELNRVPILGWYARRVGCVAVDRGKRGRAIRQMLEDAAQDSGAQSKQTQGQLVIYPQGTRVAPGATRPYKIGTGLLYQELGQPCVPVACNVGVFWPRRGIMRKPGLAVVEFLPAIEPGLEVKPFMATLEDRIESASDRLMAEAGFHKDGQT